MESAPRPSRRGIRRPRRWQRRRRRGGTGHGGRRPGTRCRWVRPRFGLRSRARRWRPHFGKRREFGHRRSLVHRWRRHGIRQVRLRRRQLWWRHLRRRRQFDRVRHRLGRRRRRRRRHRRKDVGGAWLLLRRGCVGRWSLRVARRRLGPCRYLAGRCSAGVRRGSCIHEHRDHGVLRSGAAGRHQSEGHRDENAVHQQRADEATGPGPGGRSASQAGRHQLTDRNVIM